MPVPTPFSVRSRSLLRCGICLLGGAGWLLRGVLAAVILTGLVGGVPWGLVYYIGWPLPDHTPAWDELQTILLDPLSPELLLNGLACLLWPVWAAFVLDVARATLDMLAQAPRPRARPGGPVHALAAALVGAIALVLVNTRAAPVATGAAFQEGGVHLPVAAPASASRSVTEPGTVVVRPPRNGIYDSLWRIADRTLGDGSRWPQIYALNQGRPQLDGDSLTNPNLIRPSWVLRLPHRSAPPPHQPGHDRDQTPPSNVPESPAEPSPSASPGAPSTPAHPASPPQAPHSPHPVPPQGGISLPTGAFVGAGLAALVTVALVSLRLWQRRRYQPGSGRREAVTIAPVVRALRLAHDQTVPSDDGSGDTPSPATPTRFGDPMTAVRASARARVQAAIPPQGRIIGVKDGHALAWDLARTRGMGLVGPGAFAAARALLVELLAERHQSAASRVEILIPAPDAHRLIGETPVNRPARLRIVADLDAALDVLEAELLTRARTASDPGTEPEPTATLMGEMVLIATPAPHAEHRLQALLDNGSALGMAGVLLGQWRAGGTVRVRSDGTVAATSPSCTDTLSGTRLFTLPSPDARALLDLLYNADAPAAHHEHPGHPRNDPAAAAAATGSTPAPATDEDRHEAPPTHQPESAHTPDRKEPTGAVDIPESPPATARPPREQAVPPPGVAPRSSHSSKSTEAPAGTDQDTCPPSTEQAPQQPPRERHAQAAPQSDADVRAGTPDHSLVLFVLGRVRLVHHHGDDHADITDAVAPKQREVLVYLALHPDGARRETLTTTLWPDARTDRPYNSFHATVSQLRRALRTVTHDALSDITVHHDGDYALDHDQVSVDLWDLHDALHISCHDTSEQHRRAALQRVVEIYGGELAADLTAEWLEAPREDLHRDVLDAIGTLVRSLRDTDPQQALALLERARSLDRYNEAIYRDIARFQAHLGRPDAISRTLGLLTTTLAELDDQPNRETVALFEFLQRPRPGNRPSGGQAANS